VTAVAEPASVAVRPVRLLPMAGFVFVLAVLCALIPLQQSGAGYVVFAVVAFLVLAAAAVVLLLRVRDEHLVVADGAVSVKQWRRPATTVQLAAIVTVRPEWKSTRDTTYISALELLDGQGQILDRLVVGGAYTAGALRHIEQAIGRPVAAGSETRQAGGVRHAR
jgi:hypothetical protein